MAPRPRHPGGYGCVILKNRETPDEYPIDGWGWVLYNAHYHNLNYLSLEAYEVLRQGTGNRGVAE